MVELLVAAIVAVCIGFFLISRKTTKWNADSRQQQIAQMMIEAVETGNTKLEFDILKFMMAQGWSKREMKQRTAHAVSITKIASVPATYEKTKKLGQRINETFSVAL